VKEGGIARYPLYHGLVKAESGELSKAARKPCRRAHTQTRVGLVSAAGPLIHGIAAYISRDDWAGSLSCFMSSSYVFQHKKSSTVGAAGTPGKAALYNEAHLRCEPFLHIRALSPDRSGSEIMEAALITRSGREFLHGSSGVRTGLPYTCNP